ncbi:hypothetical protein GCM10023093_15600 [Nemorincola caseinilytica]|uniref:Uncharacterized protein n=1 Tax=Nemorincola caseinilytica TaxID=2054315 RepID=A0ABP8NDT9_9BACT
MVDILYTLQGIFYVIYIQQVAAHPFHAGQLHVLTGHIAVVKGAYLHPLRRQMPHKMPAKETTATRYKDHERIK